MKLAGGNSSLFNLDETLLSWKAAAFVEHKVWAHVPAAFEEISKYKEASKMAIAVAKHVFLKHKAFSHLPTTAPVDPAELQKWKDSGSTLVQPYVEEATGKQFANNFLDTIQGELVGLYSKGLAAVAPIVDKCVKGLLGAGIGKQLRGQTLQNIPEAHPLKELVSLFLQAGKGLLCVWHVTCHTCAFGTVNCAATVLAPNGPLFNVSMSAECVPSFLGQTPKVCFSLHTRKYIVLLLVLTLQQIE